MRTVDIIVTAMFSPAAVAAVGIADLYAQIPLRMGQGLGTGAIALSSQDTGRGADAARDEAISQALLIGFIAGVPLIVAGLTIASPLIAILGAESRVVEMGGLYLMLIFSAAPVRIIGLVSARSLQGTGDTRTPMFVNGTANVLNISGTIGLGLGIGLLPNLGIVGVGLVTAISRTFEAVTMILAISYVNADVSLVRPADPVVTRQLITVSLPRFAEGMSASIANFPFNALLLVFGTEVNAAYHIGRRIYQQFAGPLYRSYSTATSIIVGQNLGAGDPAKARFSGYVITGLSVITLGLAGAILYTMAESIATLFTSDSATIAYTVSFTRVFGVSMVFFGVFSPISGSLRGAGDTRSPFYARLTGTTGFLLGFSYLAGSILGFGIVGVYTGIVLSYAWRALVVVTAFVWGNWAEQAADLMAERTIVSD